MITETEREAHRGGSDHRREQQAEERVEDAGGDRDAEQVVAERPDEVLADVAHDGARERPGAGEPHEVALDERDPGRFHGDVGAGPHRDPDVGRCERGRVVDPVPGHRDFRPCDCSRCDDLALLFGRNLGLDLVDPELCARRRAAAARLSPVSMTTRIAGARASARIASGVVGLIGSATPSRPSNLAVDDDEHDRLAVGAQRLGAPREVAGREPDLREQLSLPSAARDPTTPR